MDWLDRIHIYFISSGTQSSPDNWLYHYQTLLAGVAAVLVGVATIAVLSHQIREEKRRRYQEIDSRHRAVRAGLTFSYVELIEYYDACNEFLLSWLDNWEQFLAWDKTSELTGLRPAPKFPLNAMRNIQASIETAPERIAVEFEKHITGAQIQNSKFRDWSAQTIPEEQDSRDLVHRSNIYDVLSTTMELRSLSAHGLRYARNEASSINPDPTTQYKNEFLAFSRPRHCDELVKYLERSYGRFTKMIAEFGQQSPTE